MTLVTKISRLRHPGVLRDFSWPAELPTFGRYNLIYGWNGSGKTTISNLFRALELRKQPEGETTLATASTTIAGNDFAQATLPVRVFNRDFVTANVFPDFRAWRGKRGEAGAGRAVEKREGHGTECA